jgi:hypothetical protein
MSEHGTFTCEGCGGTFEKIRSDAQAWEEAAAMGWPGFPQDMVIACDDCFRGILWYNALSEGERRFWHTAAGSAAPRDAWLRYRGSVAIFGPEGARAPSPNRND